MPSQADKIMAYMEHRVEVLGEQSVQKVASNLETALKKNTPKRTGRTAASWRQTKNEDGSITLHTVLPNGQPARYLRELNDGNAQQAPTKFIEASIAQALDKLNNGGDF